MNRLETWEIYHKLDKKKSIAEVKKIYSEILRKLFDKIN
jgi:hypothetical protein